MNKKKVEDALARAKVEENKEIESLEDLKREDKEFRRESKQLKKMLK